MLTEASIIEERVRIPGHRRSLEGRLFYPVDHVNFAALIAGPHPFLGGDMRNNVVGALQNVLASQGGVVLAFNYAGVGQSEGGPADWPAAMSTFWEKGTINEERDWVADTSSARIALRQWCDVPPVLLGYSFGCWAVTRDLPASDAKAIVLISPNPRRHALGSLSPCHAPVLVIHSDNDFTCSVSETKAWADSLRQPKTRIQLSAGEHFFRGHEAEVADVVVQFLKQHNVFEAA